MIKMVSKIFIAIMICCASVAQAAPEINPGETYEFTKATRCEATEFGSVPLIAVWMGECYDDLANAKAEAIAYYTVAGADFDVTAFANVITDFDVSKKSAETVLDATVSAEVEWLGHLFGASLVGSGASVEIEMFLRDETTGLITGSILVESRSQATVGIKGLEAGGTRVWGNKQVTFPAKVVRGHDHSIELKVNCTADAGWIGFSTGCHFTEIIPTLDLGLPDGYVKWNSLAITVEQDIFERIDDIEEGHLEEMISSNEMIVNLYLPEANGGKLEKVGQLVIKRIQQQKDAGLGIGKAQMYIDYAYTAYYAGEYKLCYRYLINAYDSLQYPIME